MRLSLLINRELVSIAAATGMLVFLALLLAGSIFFGRRIVDLYLNLLAWP